MTPLVPRESSLLINYTDDELPAPVQASGSIDEGTEPCDNGSVLVPTDRLS
jgi:hypothetical protein